MRLGPLSLSAVLVSQTIGCVGASPRAPKGAISSSARKVPTVVEVSAHDKGTGDIFGPAPATSAWVDLPRVTITAQSPPCVDAEQALRERQVRTGQFVPWAPRRPTYDLGDPVPIPISPNAYDVADRSEAVAAALEQTMKQMDCSVDAPVHVKVGFLDGRTLPNAVLVLAGTKPRCLDAALNRVCSRPGFANVTVRPGQRVFPWEQSSPPFDRGLAAASLASVDVRSCKSSDGPTGEGHVNVTFERSGGVLAVEVDRPPFSGTSVGGCIAAKFRAARVPPFSGGPATVGKGFTVP